MNIFSPIPSKFPRMKQSKHIGSWNINYEFDICKFSSKSSKNVLTWVSISSFNRKQNYLVQIQQSQKEVCGVCFVFFRIKQKTDGQSAVNLVN